IPQLAVADHDSGRVHAGVSREALELLALTNELRDALVRLDQSFELGLDLERLLDGEHLALPLFGDEAREPLRFLSRNPHRARHVLDHAARLEVLERRDLPDAVVAVLLGHVADDLVAPRHAEIDVEVGHADALRVQEALEQEVVGERIDLGDPERVGDQRARARAAARPDWNAPVLRLADEVPDDEEVARVLHTHDHVELALEPFAIRGDVHFLAGLRELAEAIFEPVPRDVTEV